MTKKMLQHHLVINLEHEPIIFDYMGNGITITDKHSSILYTNPAFKNTTGYSKEEAKGENPAILHSGKHDQQFFEDMWKSIIKRAFGKVKYGIDENLEKFTQNT